MGNDPFESENKNQSKGFVPDRPKHVILASRTEEENIILQKKFETLHGLVQPSVRMTTTRPQATRLELGGHPDLVVFNFNDWKDDELNWVTSLRAEGYQKMIMILAKQDVPTAVQNLRYLDRVVYLEKPYEIKDLVGIAAKALKKGTVAQRIFRRFPTQQTALVELPATRGPISSRLFNISQSGAYLELNALQAVRIGEKVRLQVELPDLNRMYVMPAKVVWTSSMGRSGGTGLGVHFTGPGDLKRNIVQV